MSDNRQGIDPAYSEADRSRFHPEPPKSPTRTAFERDRARVLHSAGLRRLSTKTQVMGPADDDFVRNRLTHSLEVAQVGRELGKILGCNPDVVETACLVHDMGHPPFGHNGERALNEVAASIGGFEGNAQTLRLLTRLEAKTFAQGRSVGLNLTRATLDASCKYPWPQGGGPAGSNPKKFGVYDDDVEIFTWLRQGVDHQRRCIEAQVMDLADDIAYSVHDVEDGIASGRINPSDFTTASTRDAIVASTRQWYGPSVSADRIAAAIDRLCEQEYWVREFRGSRQDLAALKNMTSQVIGRFVSRVEEATRTDYGAGRLVRYDADLHIPAPTRDEILAMKGIAVHFVMEPREYDAAYLLQRTLIFDLADALVEGRGQGLEPAFQEDWQRADSDAQRLRIVVDQLASLTDTSAHRMHAALCGMFSQLP